MCRSGVGILLSAWGILCGIVCGKCIGANFDAFGWNVIAVADGNDVELILGALEQAKACKCKPTCLILNTVKGKGATFAEPSGAHSSQPTKEQWDEAIAASEAALAAVKNEKKGRGTQ